MVPEEGDRLGVAPEEGDTLGLGVVLEDGARLGSVDYMFLPEQGVR